MKSTIVAVVTFFLILQSCSSRPSSVESSPTTDSLTIGADSGHSSYLPIPLLLASDRHQVEENVAGIMRKTIHEGRVDSAFIKIEEFKQLASAFDLVNFDSVQFTKNYTESSIVDETAETVQLLYTAKYASQSIPKLIVYIKKAAGGDKVDMVYLDKNFNRSDTSFTQRLTWKFGRYYQIVTQREGPGEFKSYTVEKVIWEPADYGDR